MLPKRSRSAKAGAGMTAARSGALVEHLVAVQAVISDRGGADEHPRSLRRRAHGLDQLPRRLEAALQDAPLPRLAPASGADVLAGEVDDGVRPAHGVVHC